ncbi:hypothetical protein [Geminocystis sp. GBBB08]|uniref:hypothetical protein n=1 Tax=Geminocystis sp. GBBB08 TaxID=2604140 RepID=UPI0027E2D3D0|nr:hypothetical protein [Geminocystis sp. GBBB08]MBL1211677.1 hypothetical protein [Geminocystis sp. GBBB08]
MRKILYQNPVVASRLGFNNSIPNFFHFTAKDTFIETHEKGILVTQWQDTPLFRYLLGDEVSLYSWPDLKQKLIMACINQNICPQLLEIINNSSDYLPDVLALKGRSDNAIILFGINITQYLLDKIIKHEELRNILTGIYYAQVIYQENGRQVLKIDLETKPNIELNTQLQEQVYSFIIKTLCELHPLFTKDWEIIYSQWEKISNKRIVELKFHSYPNLSQDLVNKNKHQGIIKSDYHEL